MGDYFEPWQRKRAVFWLLLSCVLTMWWVRGLRVQDQCSWKEGTGHRAIYNSIVTSKHGLMFIWYYGYDDEPGGWTLGWSQEDIEEYWDLTRDSTGQTIRWKHQVAGFDFGGMRVSTWHQAGWFRASYPTIVITLTLMSAWLLFSKPREKTASPTPI